MRRSVPTAYLTRLAPFALAVAGACGGSGTSTTNPLDTNEPAPSGYEKPPSGYDNPPSSTDPVGTSGARGIPLCMNPPSDIEPCIACVESSCASELAPVVSACSAFLNCYDMCDCSDNACITACEPQITAACETAAEGLESCVTQGGSCADTCSQSSVSTSFGSTDGGTTVVINPPPGGGSATGCSALSTCCGSLPSLDQSACNSVVSTNNATTCTEALETYQTTADCQ